MFGDESRTDVTAVEAVVSSLNGETMRSHTAIQQALGVSLEEIGGNSSFGMWEARDVEIHGLRIERILYRGPKPGGAATAGPILTMRVARDGCVSQEAVRSVVSDLVIGNPPSPHAADPEQSFVRDSESDSLFFAFPMHGPDCLRELGYSLKRP